MIIIWGTRKVRRSLGYVADFCETCEAVTANSLHRVGAVTHIYYISFGQGKLLGHERKCQVCKVAAATDPAQYATVARQPMAIEHLVAQTYPDIDDVLRARFALKAKVQHAPSTLTSQERARVIREPFFALLPKVQERFSESHLDKEICMALVGAFVLFLVGTVLRERLFPQLDIGLTTSALLLLGLAWVVWQGATAGQRYIRRQIVPLLGEALLPLQPSEKELQAVIDELRGSGQKMGRKLRALDLLMDLEKRATQRGVLFIDQQIHT